MKPFDLEKALAGEAVILRCKQKAFVKYTLPNNQTSYTLHGYRLDAENWSAATVSWTEQGHYERPEYEHQYDIIGMWEEPNHLIRKQRGLNIHEAMEAVKEGYWVARNLWEDKALFLLKGDAIDGAITDIVAGKINLDDQEVEVFDTLYIHYYEGAYENCIHVYNPTQNDLFAGDWEIVRQNG